MYGPMKKRNNSENGDDKEIWNTVTRSVKAYGAQKTAPAEKIAPVHKKTSPAVSKAPAPQPPRAKMPEFDSAIAARLKKGDMAIEGRLDLHGMTQDEALFALSRFIPSAATQGKRTLLVITGKGAMMQGVLRRMLPLWLEQDSLKRHILAYSPAKPKDGGEGAFYIRLRKQK